MNKPKVRFQGYTDDWEQRKLSEITTSYSGGTPQAGNVEYYNGDIPFIRSGEIYEEHTELFITQKGMDNSSAKLVSEGDILYALYGATSGEVSRAKLGGAINQAILAIIPSEGYNADFLVEWFRKEKENITEKYLQGGQGNLSAQIIKNLEIKLPSFEEQELVGDCFSRINHLITLHQRKCDETKMLKKYMIQKMFPKDGKCVPEIRFSGYTDDWEQRKLGDVVERITRKNQDLVSTLPLTISAQYGLIDQNEFFDKRVASKDVSGYYLVNRGEFAYNKSTSSDAPWGAIKRLDRYENGVLSTLYIVFGIKDEGKVDSDYLVSYYDTNLWHRGVREIASEGARNHGLLNIAPADFFETSLMIPQDIEEQKKIGKCFERLNALITLHQRKCDELKKMKKFMLQNMFV
jgi:type I restriction enzyme S subunit